MDRAHARGRSWIASGARRARATASATTAPTTARAAATSTQGTPRDASRDVTLIAAKSVDARTIQAIPASWLTLLPSLPRPPSLARGQLGPSPVYRRMAAGAGTNTRNPAGPGRREPSSEPQGEDPLRTRFRGGFRVRDAALRPPLGACF